MPTTYICLLGFAAESENRIKKLLEQENVVWVPPNFQGLNGVILNTVFLSAPQIKKYLEQISARVVCAHNRDEADALAAERGYIALDLRNPSANFNRWIAHLFNRPVQPYRPAPQQPGLASGQEDIFLDATSGGADTKPTGRVLRLLERLENGQRQVVLRLESGAQTTWIHTGEGMAFINYPREKITGVEHWSCREVQENDISEQARPLKLEVWLFEALWQSDFEPQDMESDARYHLTRWPQPLGRKGRSEALKLASLSQAYPVSVEELQEKTNYPEGVIKRFLFAAWKTGQLVVSYGTSRPQPKERDTSKETEEKRGLLRRLRDKFGM